MATIELTAETFESTILNPGVSSGIVLVDFWAGWCGPCLAFAPVYGAASEDNPDVVFGKVDTEENRDLSGALDIRSIPTLMIFRDGIGVFSQAGALPRHVLDDLLTRVRELDMDDVRARIAEAQAAEVEPADSQTADA
jgi:thioredoxin 1